MGTGTTAIVAKELKRKFIGSEILKDYCKIANRRIKEIGTLI
jgi:site-specific DNA-methyltransferase (adenine-specific)